MPIALKLPGVMVSIAIVVGTGIGVAAYAIGMQTVEAQRTQAFSSSIQSGLDAVHEYIGQVSVEIALFAARSETVAQLQGMTTAFADLDADGGGQALLQLGFITNNPEAERKTLDASPDPLGNYNAEHHRRHRNWLSLLDRRGYEDIMLFTTTGRLIYSVQKNSDFAADLGKSSYDPLAQTELARVVREAMTLGAGEFVVSDFTAYAPANGRPVHFVATPVVGPDATLGVLVFELSPEMLTSRMRSIRGLGVSGEAIVVGGDGLLRTQSKVVVSDTVLVSSLDLGLLQHDQGASTSTVITGPDGTAMYAMAVPVSEMNVPWSVVALQSKDEVLAPVNAMGSTMLLAGLLLLASATVVVLLFSRTITKPIARLSKTMDRLVEGSLDVQVGDTARGDEVGRMAKSVEVFRENARRIATLTEEEKAGQERRRVDRTRMMSELQDAFGNVVDAAALGDFSKRVGTSFADSELNRLASSVNNLVETVERGLSETGSVLSALAKTDLTHRVEGDYEGAFKRLKTDTNAVAETLGEIVQRLRTSSRSLRVATAEILSGSNDLSERTTRQASTIEETSTAMDHLSRTVLENAQRAKEASVAAVAVTRTAEQGGEVMSRATDAMDRISTSSRKISSIIGLIDDIAFQTNLLALNASVEAARAGDLGKGFAVVAVEVRRLAQSAAKASADVKLLVEQSSGEVDGGARLVSEVAGQLNEMVSAARVSSGLMEAIAHESQQQALAIEEVSGAVRQIGQITQENSALVEETNASIGQTEQQAEVLDQIVSVFAVHETPVNLNRAHERPRLRVTA